MSRWMLHGTPRSETVESIRFLGLTPGDATIFDEPAGCWLTNRLQTARWCAMPRREQSRWQTSAGLARERFIQLDRPDYSDVDHRVVVVEVSGLMLHRHPRSRRNPTPTAYQQASDMWFADAVEPDRIVGTLYELGVRQVLAHLWNDPIASQRVQAYYAHRK